MTDHLPTRTSEEAGVLKLVRNKWVQSGIAGIPFAGGPIQAYLSNVLLEVDRKCWEQYWTSVEDKLAELGETKIDVDYFSSEDFVRRLRRIYTEVTSGSDATKLHYLRDYFVACASTLEVDTTWKDVVLGHLKDLTGTHLLVLRFFYDTQKHLSSKDRFELRQRVSDSPIVSERIVKGLKGADALLAEMIVADLCSRGLLAPWLGSPPEPKGWSITDAGLRLMHFLRDLWEMNSEHRTTEST
jgi:hypothetical protein